MRKYKKRASRVALQKFTVTYRTTLRGISRSYEQQPNSATSRMLATTSYFHNAGVFGILAILATVFAVALGHALAPAVRAFFIVCHTTPPCYSGAMLEPRNCMVKLQGAERTTIVRLRSPKVRTIGLSNCIGCSSPSILITRFAGALANTVIG